MSLEQRQNPDTQNQKSTELAEEERLNQGEKASEIFHGKTEVEPVKKIFGESAKLFAGIIRERLEVGKEYRLADFGSHKGELLEDVCAQLPEFRLHTVGIDLEKNLRENNAAQEKISSDLGNIPLADKSVDFGFARYVLHWNGAEKQQQILKEIARIVKDFAVIQHVGADSENPDVWRKKVDDLMDGAELPKLERHGHFFSSSEEIESWLTENNIPFEKVLEVCINDLAETLTKRFSLSEYEKQIAKEMLNGSDYIIQTTWIITPNKEEK